MSRYWDRRLLILALCAALVCMGYAIVLTPYVMPNFYDASLPLAERLESTSMGDSDTYGRYADGLLNQGAFQRTEGVPALKHMPGLPLILAVSYAASGSLDGFRVFQALFFFASLYCFLVRIRDRIPPLVLTATVVIMALHPMLAQHFTAVMSDILFTSMLLWTAVVLDKPQPGYREFVGAGLLLGLAVYIRESAFVFMAAVALAYLIKDVRAHFTPVVAMGCVFVAMLSPWAVRNYVHTQEFIPLTTKARTLFYYYSIPLTTAVYRPFGGYDFVEVNRRFGEKLPANPVAAGIRNYISHPKEQLTSGALKTLALFGSPGMLRRPLSRVATIALTAFHLAAAVFHVAVILFGVLLAFSRRSRPFPYLPYLIGAQYVQALFLWSESRYLMPFYPFVIMMALTWYVHQARSPLYASSGKLAAEAIVRPHAEQAREGRSSG